MVDYRYLVTAIPLSDINLAFAGVLQTYPFPLLRESRLLLWKSHRVRLLYVLPIPKDISKLVHAPHKEFEAVVHGVQSLIG